ncbi:MAG TPA: FHA domain-containing protein, partial [Planctomycetota bacterium]|nr:FHA domain-containing protein [Planctomycetota bacterium]
MADSPGASMALFRAFSMPGRKPRGEWIAPAIDVGTRSTCALNLNDPVVAEHHCTFRANAAGFVVEDLGSATGTWHNGIAVAGSVQISSGDQVVIGVTRLSLEIKSEAERAVLEIQVEEASFHYKKPKSGEFHSDADEWVRSEVRFGRIPAVRKAAWLAGFVALIALVFVFTTRTGEKLLQPGSLDGSHAAFFASDPEAILGKNAALSPAFVAARERVAHESCKVCHASSPPGDVSSCVACHTEMATRHPFLRGDATADARLAAGVEKPSDGCRLCHDVQHAGLSPSESIAAARARIREGTEEANPGWGVCTSCHVSGLVAPAETMPRVRELSAMLVDASAKPATDRHEYAFDEFSHRAHLNPKGRAIDCAVCHVEAPAGGGETSADFRAVAFTNCAACHVSGMPVADDLPGIPSAELKSLRKELESKKMLVTMSWHGRGDRCLACHAEAGKPELKQATREAATKTYGIVRMGHTEHANAAKGSKADCAVCHGDMKTLAGGAKSEGKEFLHGSHVETLWPASVADQT